MSFLQSFRSLSYLHFAALLTVFGGSRDSEKADGPGFEVMQDLEDTRGALIASIHQDFPNRPAAYYRAIPDGHGGIWAAHGLSPQAGVDMEVNGALFRLDAESGQPMAEFNLSVVDPMIFVMDVFPDGSALVTTSNGDRELLRKILPSGLEDPDFEPFPTNRTRMAKVLSNGDIIVAVSESYYRREPGGAKIFRLLADGRPDPDWQVAHLSTDEIDWAETNVWARIVEDPQGRLLIGGMFNAVNEVPTGNVVRLFPDGRLDTGFFADSETYLGWPIRALAIQSDGKVIVGSVFPEADSPGAVRPGMIRLNDDGSRDSGFVVAGPGEMAGTYFVYDIEVLADDRIVAVGMMGVVRFLKDGALDPDFDQVRSSPLPESTLPQWVNDSHFWIEVMQDGLLISGTNFSVGAVTAGVAHSGLFKLSDDGEFIHSFRPPAPFSLGFPNRVLNTPFGLLAWGEAHTQGLNLPMAIPSRIGEQAVGNVFVIDIEDGELHPQTIPEHAAISSANPFQSAMNLSNGDTVALMRVDGRIELHVFSPDGSGLFTLFGFEIGELSGMRSSPEDAIAVISRGGPNHYDFYGEGMYPLFQFVVYGEDLSVMNYGTVMQAPEVMLDPVSGLEQYYFASTEGVQLWHVDADLRIIVTVPDEMGDPVLRRYLADGRVDTSFRPVTFSSRLELAPRNMHIQALQRNAEVRLSAAVLHSVIVRPDGTLLVGGEFDEAVNSEHTVVDSPMVLIDPAAHGAESLFAPVLISSDPVSALSPPIVHEIIDAGGYVYVIGSFTHCEESEARGIVRLFASDLSPDPRFVPGIEFVHYDYIRPSPGGGAILPDGNLLVTGQFRAIGEIFPKPFHVLDARSHGNWVIDARPAMDGLGSVTGSGEYPDGSFVEVTAIPSAGYRFMGWQEFPEVTDSVFAGYIYQDLSLTAVFEEIPLTLEAYLGPHTFAAGSGQYLSFDTDGYNLQYEWLIGDDPHVAMVYPSLGGNLYLDDLKVFGGQTVVVRLRIRDGFGNELLSEPSTIILVSPFDGMAGGHVRDTYIGDLAVVSDDVLHSSIVGWVFHHAYPWVFQPDWGWMMAPTQDFGTGFDHWWSPDFGWLLVPTTSSGEFLIVG